LRFDGDAFSFVDEQRWDCASREKTDLVFFAHCFARVPLLMHNVRTAEGKLLIQRIDERLRSAALFAAAALSATKRASRKPD
jgi:hypothetical protein